MVIEGPSFAGAMERMYMDDLRNTTELADSRPSTPSDEAAT